jgi:peptidoglycan/LPS O-acetylase OafA/YrhL
VRAVAVAAVVLYHARPSWMRGGFLGVDVFFVLSGFLITSMLLREHRESGRVGLRSFWMRRARRLLPALYLLLGVAIAVELLAHLGAVTQLRWDALAALGYATNWFLIGHQQSYFIAFSTPDALQHLWSLAVEEQFYLLWPLVAALGLLRRRRALWFVLGGALGSTLLCALVFDPHTDPSRVYYGTDTHSAGLLVGAGLALLYVRAWPRASRVVSPSRRVAWAVGAAGVGGLAALLASFAVLGETQPFVYRGGLLVVALCSACFIGALLHPGGRRLASLFAWWPLRWVGVRSYGIYLWHWPVLVLTSPHGNPGDAPLARTLLQVAASVGLAALSFRYVETPVRSGAVMRVLRRQWSATSERHVAMRLAWGAGGGAAIGCACALVVGVAATRPPAPAGYQRTVAVRLVIRPTPAATAMPTPAPTPLPQTPTAVPPTPTPPPPPPPPPPPAHVTAVGDSVMLGAAGEMARDIPNLDLDAKVGRQLPAAVDVLRAARDAGHLGPVVVVHIGTNGYVTRGQFDDMMSVLSGVQRVVVVNDKVPRPWQDPNDDMLAQAASAYPQVRIVDWRAASTARPELFWDDDTHLRPEGARFYASLVAAQVMAADPTPAPAPPPAPTPAPSPTPAASPEESPSARAA